MTMNRQMRLHRMSDSLSHHCSRCQTMRHRSSSTPPALEMISAALRASTGHSKPSENRHPASSKELGCMRGPIISVADVIENESDQRRLKASLFRGNCERERHRVRECRCTCSRGTPAHPYTLQKVWMARYHGIHDGAARAKACMSHRAFSAIAPL